VHGAVAELVGGVDDDLACQLVAVVADEGLDRAAGDAEDDRFGAVKGSAHRSLGLAGSVADIVSGRGECLAQGLAEVACADDCDVHAVSFVSGPLAVRQQHAGGLGLEPGDPRAQADFADHPGVRPVLHPP
jgi:hypothetical protein